MTEAEWLACKTPTAVLEYVASPAAEPDAERPARTPAARLWGGG